MIARMWRGWVRTEKAREYVDIVERTGMSWYRSTPGNAGRAFAGEDIETAKYYPEDDEYLLDREATVAHFEVAPAHEEPGVGQQATHTVTAGFSVARVLPADLARVFERSIEPETFSHWFVVSGYSTPAANLNLDVRPGGSISGLRVSDRDGTEVPFQATYGVLMRRTPCSCCLAIPGNP